MEKEDVEKEEWRKKMWRLNLCGVDRFKEGYAVPALTLIARRAIVPLPFDGRGVVISLHEEGKLL